jgi:sulfite exporter TauE/SafE
MTGTLLLTATLMGAAATPHCAAMCAGACRMLATRAAGPAQSRRWWAWLSGRLLGYAVGGAAAASLGGMLRWLADSQAWARPVWLMLQLVMLALGLTLLWRGRLPLALEQWLDSGRRPTDATPAVQVVRWKADLQAASTGALWVALPCGVLQAALVVAALASSPVEGAGAMALFALASTPGLVAGQWLWRKLWPSARDRTAGVTSTNATAAPTVSALSAQDAAPTWSLRLAGAGIALLSGGTVAMAAWAPLAAWCA